MLPIIPSRAGEELHLADPERALAVAYAPSDARPALAALFALDERLGSVVAATTEPTIGLIRLAWWREALERLDSAPPPAEPLLTALAAHCLPLGVNGAALAKIEDGWAALLDGMIDAAAIARHGRARGGGLFVAASIIPTCHAGLVQASTPGRWSSPERRRTPEQVRGDGSVEIAGTVWALADLNHRLSTPAVRAEARAQARAMPDEPSRWPRPLRPLGALAVLARRDAVAEARVQGSPGRLLRMLAHRATGS